jgi:hypothetical protein
MDEPTAASTVPRVLALLCCAFAYLYVFPYQAQINNPNENVRFYMTAAIVEEGRFEIDTLRARWGYVNDAATHGGHVYSVKAPGTSLLAVPGYAAYRALSSALGRPFDRTEALWACRLVATVIPTLLFFWWFHVWLSRRGFHPVLRDAAFFSVALGSMLYGYGMLLVSHTLSAVVAFGAFMLLYDAREDPAPCGHARAFAAGLLAAATTLFEYPALPVSVALTAYAMYVLWRRGGVKPIAAYALGGLIPALIMMHFQWRAFGNPLTPGHLFVENDAFRAAHHQGLYGATGPTLEALYGLLIDLGAGLFPLTPLLVFGVFGLVQLARDRERRPDAIAAIAIVVLSVLVISSMNNWRGGWTIGARYLAVIVPFLAWAALCALERLAERWEALAIALAVGTTATGMFASGLPSAYYPHLPPELTRPLPQLFFVLIAHDYAPLNAGALLGVYGTPSMLPLLLVALGALALCLRPVEGWRARGIVAALALMAAAGTSALLFVPPRHERGVAEAVAFITRHWSPVGHDKAASLTQELRAQPVVRDEQLKRLAEVYSEEGRTHEAQRASRGKL